MNVLLSLGPVGGEARTGVYRVTDKLLTGLSLHPSLKIYFHSQINISNSHKYFYEHLSQNGSELVIGFSGREICKISKYCNNFILNTSKNKNIIFRITRKIFACIMQTIDKISLLFTEKLLSNIELYHSTFYHIPHKIKKSGKIKRFTTIYDLIAITHPEYFEKEIIDLLKSIISSLASEDYTICISEYTRTILLDNSKVSPERAFVVPLAASEHFYPSTDMERNKAILKSYGIDSPNFILSLCTFEIRKNLEAVIKAFAQLHEKSLIPADTYLVLVGGKGWKTKNIENALSSASSVRDRILMPGFIPDEDLAAIYSSARVFTYMSFMEGFGLPPLEAMQCATPVVTSNTSSLPEVVGDAGIMLDPNDIHGLTEAISRIYRDDTFHAELSQKSINRAKLFSWERFTHETVDAYRKALNN